MDDALGHQRPGQRSAVFSSSALLGKDSLKGGPHLRIYRQVGNDYLTEPPKQTQRVAIGYVYGPTSYPQLGRSLGANSQADYTFSGGRRFDHAL